METEQRERTHESRRNLDGPGEKHQAEGRIEWLWFRAEGRGGGVAGGRCSPVEWKQNGRKDGWRDEEMERS
jgi:hypothetical protein